MEEELVKNDDGRYDCRFNDGCHCYDLDCGRCGWNPVVARARLHQWLKKMGVVTDDEKVTMQELP